MRVESFEECDTGPQNISSSPGCNATCQVQPGYHCDGGSLLAPDACLPQCGDGLAVGDEECDDGNWDNGDGCSEDCMPQGQWR